MNAPAPETMHVPPSAIKGHGKWAPRLHGPEVAANLDIPWRTGCLGDQKRSKELMGEGGAWS